MKKAALIVFGTLLIIFGLLVPLATTVITFLLPETFAASATILHTNANPALLAGMVAKVQSQAVLDQAIADLNLRAEWGRKYKQPGELPAAKISAILKGNIEVTQVRGTNLMEIKVLSDNKDEAAGMANKLASIYLSATPGAAVAVPAFSNPTPVRPNKPVNITIGAVVGAFLILPGTFLLIAARRSKHPA